MHTWPTGVPYVYTATQWPQRLGCWDHKLTVTLWHRGMLDAGVGLS